MVMDLYDNKLRATLDMGFISDRQLLTREEYIDTIYEKHRVAFKTAKRQIPKATVMQCIETELENRMFRK